MKFAAVLVAAALQQGAKACLEEDFWEGQTTCTGQPDTANCYAMNTCRTGVDGFFGWAARYPDNDCPNNVATRRYELWTGFGSQTCTGTPGESGDITLGVCNARDGNALFYSCRNVKATSNATTVESNYMPEFAKAAIAKLRADLMEKFEGFVTKFDKSYATRAEFERRAMIFAENLQKAEQMNAESVAAGGEATFGATRFSDLTAEEFKATYLMEDYQSVTADADRVVPEGPVANDIDWRTQGAVTPVKDQGQCGSCWAFSATEAIESYAKLSGKYSLQQLSPQQINSCDKRDGGCRGGNTETAYNYVHQAGGIETEASYPYTSGHGQTGTCKADPSKFAVSIAGYRSVARGESNLATALNSGPASICVAADAFQSYRGGILSSCPGRIDHCVQAVGYTADYWIVRNSWGTRWGEQGFIRVKRGSNLCHISDDVTYPTF